MLSGRETGLERQLGGVDPFGYGVFATQDFFEGDYVCQYKGDWLTVESAKYLEEKGYRKPEYQMYVERRGGGGFYINQVVDASEPCYALTMGRNINHSIANANVVQRLFQDKTRKFACIYFKALRHIKKGEEILYNYGDTRLGTTLGNWSEKIMVEGRAMYRKTCVTHPDEGMDSFDLSKQ